MVEENPFPRAWAQPVHVRDDHDIAGVRPVHSPAGVRIQKDHDGPRKTADVALVVISRRYRPPTPSVRRQQ